MSSGQSWSTKGQDPQPQAPQPKAQWGAEAELYAAETAGLDESPLGWSALGRVGADQSHAAQPHAAQPNAAQPNADEADQAAQGVEAVVSRLNQRLDQAEAATLEAIQGLQVSFEQLGGRVRSLEASSQKPVPDGSSEGAEQRLKALAGDLQRQVEDVRAELVQSLKATTDNRFGQVARALEAMGLHMQSAERRSTAAIEQISGEVARMGGALDQRLGRYETVQSQALERLSGEIDRITDRLSERIAVSESRSARAVNEASEHLSQVTDGIAERTFRATSDLSERIRQSEERTARLLAEARERLDQRLARPESLTEDGLTEGDRHGAGALTISASDILNEMGEEAVAPAHDLAASVQQFKAEFVNPFMDMADALEARPAADDADWDEAGFAVDVAPDWGQDGPGDPVASVHAWGQHDDEEDEGLFSSGPASELAARVEARLALGRTALAPVAPEPSSEARTDEARADRDLGAALRVVDSPREAAKPAAVESVRGGLFGPSAFGQGRRAPPRSRPLRMGGAQRALMVAVVTPVFVSLAIAGLVFINSGSRNVSPAQAYQALVEKVSGKSHAGAVMTASAAVNAPTPTSTPIPRVAVALLSPNIAEKPSAASSSSAAFAAQYADAMRIMAVDSGKGLSSLKRLAGQGYPPAQAKLGKLYETGGSGLPADMAEARRWTERAARSGDVGAMHAMGLYHYYGEGGDQNSALAAQWFRRAAERGLLDSQYNLAQLYETGLGVGPNASEAYKWYRIASLSGDEEALKKVAALKGKLSPEAQGAMDQAARAFKAQP